MLLASVFSMGSNDRKHSESASQSESMKEPMVIEVLLGALNVVVIEIERFAGNSAAENQRSGAVLGGVYGSSVGELPQLRRKLHSLHDVFAREGTTWQRP